MLITSGALKTRLKKPRSRRSAFRRGRAGGLVRTSSGTGLVMPMLSRGAARGSSPWVGQPASSPPRMPPAQRTWGARATALATRASSGAQGPQNASCQLLQATRCPRLAAPASAQAGATQSLGGQRLPGSSPGSLQPGGQAEPAGRAAVLPSLSGPSLTSTLQTSNTSAEHGSCSSHRPPSTGALGEQHDASLASSPHEPRNVGRSCQTQRRDFKQTGLAGLIPSQWLNPLGALALRAPRDPAGPRSGREESRWVKGWDWLQVQPWCVW